MHNISATDIQVDNNDQSGTNRKQGVLLDPQALRPQGANWRRHQNVGSVPNLDDWIARSSDVGNWLLDKKRALGYDECQLFSRAFSKNRDDPYCMAVRGHPLCGQVHGKT